MRPSMTLYLCRIQKTVRTGTLCMNIPTHRIISNYQAAIEIIPNILRFVTILKIKFMKGIFVGWALGVLRYDGEVILIDLRGLGRVDNAEDGLCLPETIRRSSNDFLLTNRCISGDSERGRKVARSV